MILRADTLWTYIEGITNLPNHILDPVTSYKVDGYWFSQAYKRGFWDGSVRFIEKDRTVGKYRFPTGFLSRVTEALDKAGYSYTLEDLQEYDYIEPVRTLNSKNGILELDKGIYDYQYQVLETALTHGRGILHIATGGGKTEIGAGILASINKKSIWLTHRVNLALQSQARISERLGKPVGLLGNGVRDIQDITVVMVQTASNTHDAEFTKYLSECECVIGDEIHHLESDQWYSFFKRINAKYRFGLSATVSIAGPGLSLLGMTGDIISSVGVIELIKRTVLVPPRIWFLEVKEPDLKSVRNYQSAYKQGIVENTVRNEAICRVATVFKKEKKFPLTLVKRINHGELLTDMMSQRGIRAEFICGKVDTETRNLWIQQLISGEIDHIVAVSETMGEGVDIPVINAIINATGSKGGGSEDGEVGRQTLQFLGRTLRRSPGKLFCDYVDVADTTNEFLRNASLARLATLESEGYAPFIKYWREYEPAF